MPKAPRARKPSRRSYHHGDLRRTLISTALAMVQEEDVAALTLREVARRAGVTHSAPYHHFPTKNHLLAAIAEDGFRELYTKQLQAVARAGTDPVKRLQALGTTYVEFAVENTGYFRVMFRSNTGGWVEFPSVLEASSLGFVLLTTTAEEARKAGNLGVDLMEFTLAAWSVVHGLSTLWVDGPLQRVSALRGDKSIQEIAARITAVSTERLGPR
jgi:AcrR family transcriptional regulator